MTISADDVRHIARLGRLDLTDGEIERFQRELSQILDYVAQLESLEAGRAAEPSSPDQPLREDRVEGQWDVEALQSQAPHFEDDHFRVPRVVQ